MPSAKTSTRHAPDGLILAIACVAQFMVVLDVSVVNVALPDMGRDLHFSANGAQWVVNAYVLTFAGFLLLGGRAADLLGRRRVYLAGVVLFTLASVGAGFAHTGAEMIAARAVQGLGGAILSPATLTLIVTTFKGPQLAKAIGAWSAVAGAGGAVGGLLGGVLTGWASWRWVFFINVPFGIVAVAVAALYLRELRNANATTKLDVVGAVLVTVSLTGVIYGIVSSASTSWGSRTVLSSVGGGLVGLALFVVWELKVAAHPLVPFRLFRSRPLSVANLVMLLVGGAFFAMWYFLTYFFQGTLGYGPVAAGVAFLPMALAIVIGAQISSRLLVRVGVRPLLLVGAALATGGFFALGQLSDHSSYAASVLGPSVMCAFAMGLLFSPLATAATAGVDRADAGLASGVLNTSRQVGGSLSLAVLGTVAADRTRALVEAARGSRSALVSAPVAGYSRAFAISAGVTVVAFAVAWALPHRTGRAQVSAETPLASEPA
jgi:EmrB/QacA subfamily drug resistance transporter